MLSWNTSLHTIECLRSLEKQSFKNFEVVVIDNGSKMEDYLNLRDGMKNIRKIKMLLKRLEKNSGITGGMNFGYRFLKGDYIVFMNNDMIVTKDFLSEIMSPFERYDNVGAVVPMIKSWKNGGPTNEIQLCGGKLTFYGTLLNKELEKYGRKVYNKETELDCATAGCLVTTRRVLKVMGEIFPPLYSVYFEDIDLSWRIRNAGFRIIYAPKSLVYHKGSMSTNLNEIPGTRQRFVVRNKYLTFWRNLPVLDFIVVFPFVLGFDLLRALKQILRGRFVFVGSLFRGMGDFVSSAGKVKTPRKGSLSYLSWNIESPRTTIANWNRR